MEKSLNREGAKDARKTNAQITDIETIASKIVSTAIKVHTALGPGLLESAYQKCMEYDLENDGLRVECEVVLPIRYGEITIDAGYRIDMIVENATSSRIRLSIASCTYTKHSW
jgi:hypothetical protein